MSRPTSTRSRARRAAAGSLVGLAALGGFTASAEANFKKTLTYNCIYPYVGEQPLKVEIDAAIPESWPAKTKTPAFQLSAVATAGGNTSAAIGLVGATTAEGSTKAGAIIAATGVSPLPLTVPITIPQQPVSDSGDIVLTASGSTPQVQFANPGPAKITVESIALTLIVRGADGAAIPLPEDSTEVPQTDGNPDTFQVSCALAPANQDKALVSPAGLPYINVTPGPDSPTPTTQPTPTSQPTPTPTFIPDPTPTPTPTPSPTATPSPTPVPPSPQPTPPPGGRAQVLEIGATFARIEYLTSQFATGYAIFDGDTKIQEIAPPYIGGTTSQYDSGYVTVAGLQPDTSYMLEIKKTTDGETWTSIYNNTVTFRTPSVVITPTPTPTPPPVTPTPSPSPSPTPILHAPYPGSIVVSEITETSAKVCWGGGGSGQIQSPLYFILNVPGSGQGTTQNFCAQSTGLQPGTTYTGWVRGAGAFEISNTTVNFTFTTLGGSTPTPTPTATPTPTVSPEPTDQVIPYAYSLAGSATLKTLTKGSLPLSGGIDAKLGLPSGKFTGDLTLAPSTGNLTALGFLPVTAKVNLVPTEQVTGSLKSGKLTAVAKVRIKLPSVKTFGIELAGGANCQAKQISSITLTSTQATFMPLSGGPIAGTFSISDLSGCGFLTGIVSPLTSGSGNAIALNLTPKPANS